MSTTVYLGRMAAGLPCVWRANSRGVWPLDYRRDNRDLAEVADWGHGATPGAAQLAYAILADAAGCYMAETYFFRFAACYVGMLEHATWWLAAAEVRGWLMDLGEPGPFYEDNADCEVCERCGHPTGDLVMGTTLPGTSLPGPSGAKATARPSGGPANPPTAGTGSPG